MHGIDLQEANRRAGCNPWEENGQNLVNRAAADPGLNSKPAAGNQRAQERRDICAGRAERGTAIDGKRDAIMRAGVGIEDHGNEHNKIAQENCEDSLPPVHAAALRIHEGRSEHVSRNTCGHRDPQRGKAAGAPLSSARGDRSEVRVEQLAIL